MRFPYQKEKSNLFGEIYKPIAEFEVETRAGWITLLAYIDSGADVSILPRISPLVMLPIRRKYNMLHPPSHLATYRFRHFSNKPPRKL
ncbi:MAG: hypothetical protein ACUVQ0_06960 [Thermoproteota archaeon]